MSLLTNPLKMEQNKGIDGYGVLVNKNVPSQVSLVTHFRFDRFIKQVREIRLFF